MYKTKLVHCCDVVPNLVVEIEIFNFCLFVCLLVWDILAQLPRRSIGLVKCQRISDSELTTFGLACRSPTSPEESD